MTEYLDASGSWHRTVGRVLEELRGRYYFGVLALLAEGPKEKREMHAALAAAHGRLRWLCGEQPMPDDALRRPLQKMLKMGLLEHVRQTSAFPQVAAYQLSEISENLLGSLDRLAPWCEANSRYLERMTRIKNRVDPELPSGHVPQRAQVGMAFGLFTPRWSWGLLSVISEGPRNPRDLFTANAAHIASNSYSTSRRMLSEKVGYDTLHWLSQCDLIAKRGAGENESGRVVYEVTARGRELMHAFQPIGKNMASYYDEPRALGGRRGQPRPSPVLARLTYRHLTL